MKTKTLWLNKNYAVVSVGHETSTARLEKCYKPVGVSGWVGTWNGIPERFRFKKNALKYSTTGKFSL